MGGKRPDQYQIDPSEAGSTDYKWRREGRSAGDKIPNEEKQHLASNPHDQPMIPEENVNPALRELRERKQSAHANQNREAAGRSGDQSADDRVDEQSQESFPASDPPQQP